MIQYSSLPKKYKLFLHDSEPQVYRRVITLLLKDGYTQDEIDELFLEHGMVDLCDEIFLETRKTFLNNRRVIDLALDYIWHSLLSRKMPVHGNELTILLILTTTMKKAGSYTAAISIRELAKQSRIHFQTALNTIDRLVNKEYIDKSNTGYTNSYTFTQKLLETIFPTALVGFKDMLHILSYYMFYSLLDRDIYIILRLHSDMYFRTIEEYEHDEELTINNNDPAYPLLNFLYDFKETGKRIILSDYFTDNIDLQGYGGLSKHSIPFINYMNENIGKAVTMKQIRDNTNLSNSIINSTIKKIGRKYLAVKGQKRGKRIFFKQVFDDDSEIEFIKKNNLSGKVMDRNNQFTFEQDLHKLKDYSRGLFKKITYKDQHKVRKERITGSKKIPDDRFENLLENIISGEESIYPCDIVAFDDEYVTFKIDPYNHELLLMEDDK